MRAQRISESFAFRTPDRYEKKNTDSVIQYAGRNGTVDRSRVSDAGDEYATDTQSTDHERNDGLSTNQSEALSGRCRLVRWRRKDQWSRACRL